MPSKGGLMQHLTCLVYVPYLVKPQDPKIMNFASNCRYHNAMNLNVKLLLTTTF